MYYNRKGEPITIEEWLFQRRRYEENVLARENLANSFIVATFFTGKDPGYREELGGEPLIFETVIFDCRPSVNNSAKVFGRELYPNMAEALLGHQRLVNYYKDF